MLFDRGFGLRRVLMLAVIFGVAVFLLSGGLAWVLAMQSGVALRGQMFYVNTTFLFMSVLLLMCLGGWLFVKSRKSRSMLQLLVGFMLIFGGAWFLDLLV